MGLFGKKKEEARSISNVESYCDNDKENYNDMVI